MEWMPRNSTPQARPQRSRSLLSQGMTVAALLALLVLTPVAQALLAHSSRTPARHTARPVSLRTPSLQAPRNGVSVQSMPTFTWAAVAHASAYQFQVSADRRFASTVTNATNRGTIETTNTAATVDKAVPNGTYYWRVRAVSATGGAGHWSPVRKLLKLWNLAPQPISPVASTVNWPSEPPVLRWSPVPFATRYQATIATDEKLATPVIGTRLSPVTTVGTVYTPSGVFDPGAAYFWQVTPIDAQGHKGAPSAVASFTYAWPTSTTTEVIDRNPDPRVFDPQFNWAPIPGAVRYEVEVNSAEDFPAGSKWCCTGTTVGSSLAPTKVLANNRYYWRVRAIDAKGHSGVWNVGASFTKAFDSSIPAIPELTVRDPNGKALTGLAETNTPIVTWAPVPGASLYQVQVAPYEAGLTGCNWSIVSLYPKVYQAETASTAWTPLGFPHETAHLGPAAWPHAQSSPPFALPTGQPYCVRVLARSDDDAQNNQVISNWTQINGAAQPAFIYNETSASAPESPFITPAGFNLQPSSGLATPRTPLFTWKPIPGALGYYVVISRDDRFTEVADVGYTNVPAYAPRLDNEVPLSDETTSYYWTVIPAHNVAGGSYSNYEPCLPEHAETCNAVAAFSKASVPPQLQAPADGAHVETQPSFEWQGSENARSYRLQVAQDPNFAHPLEDITTDAISYTPTSTYPADTQLYWRVRANDWHGQGLNWSVVRSFIRKLPRPEPSAANPSAGEPIPALNWGLVQGASGYEVHVDKVNGFSTALGFPATAATPLEWFGVGVWRWQVRADFPGASSAQTVTGPYSTMQQFIRTLGAPANARGVRAGARMVVSWSPNAAAKQYEVEIATSDAFATTINSHKTDNASWAPQLMLTAALKKKTLYWRVAAVDAAGNLGSFAGGRFGAATQPKCPSAKARRNTHQSIPKRCKRHRG